ncbi:hypothetical protein AB0M47_38180 [Hamadaea sp. NPDC051192]|uniref:hypothetical protein n=1 Tax=Hamadaea sp. NPDC051192 TaxID=3154940 RepID=UPI003427D68D
MGQAVVLFEFIPWFRRLVWTCQPEDAVGHRWVKLAIGPGLTGTQIREDRILSETQATGGDMRALVDLFGISTDAGSRQFDDGTGEPYCITMTIEGGVTAWEVVVTRSRLVTGPGPPPSPSPARSTCS